jgi:glycolate oxidase
LGEPDADPSGDPQCSLTSDEGATKVIPCGVPLLLAQHHNFPVRQDNLHGLNVATNAGGPHCLLYGVTSAHVQAVEVVLSDGEVVVLGEEQGDAAGYDLRGAFIGGEGTLGIATRICVRLTQDPPLVATLLLDFLTIDEAAETVSAIIAAGILPAALELMDQQVVAAVEPFAHAGYPMDAAAVLIVELDGLPRD